VRRASRHYSTRLSRRWGLFAIVWNRTTVIVGIITGVVMVCVGALIIWLLRAGTRGLTVAGVMILMACQPHTVAKPPAPVRDSVVSRVTVRSDTISDTLLLRAMHEAQAQSARAAAQVDTIVVQPDTVRLHVGETVPLYPTVKIEARDKRGAAVPHFAPALSLGDRGIADFSGWALTGRRPGLTWLVVSPLSVDPAIKVKATKAMLWIQVEP